MIFKRKLRHSVLLLFVLTLFLGACKKDDDPGFATRDDYLGYWQCEEYDITQTPIGSFQIEIIAHPTEETKVYIDNFTHLGQGFQAEAQIESTSIVIPQQLVAGAAVVGSGFMTNGLTGLELQYSYDDGSGQPENITAICTKL